MELVDYNIENVHKIHNKNDILIIKPKKENSKCYTMMMEKKELP